MLQYGARHRKKPTFETTEDVLRNTREPLRSKLKQKAVNAVLILWSLSDKSAIEWVDAVNDYKKMPKVYLVNGSRIRFLPDLDDCTVVSFGVELRMRIPDTQDDVLSAITAAQDWVRQFGPTDQTSLRP